MLEGLQPCSLCRYQRWQTQTSIIGKPKTFVYVMCEKKSEDLRTFQNQVAFPLLAQCPPNFLLKVREFWVLQHLHTHVQVTSNVVTPVLYRGQSASPLVLVQGGCMSNHGSFRNASYAGSLYTHRINASIADALHARSASEHS